MGTLPILRFEPIFKETVWGGRLLESSLLKTLPGDGPVGESWEIVDLPSDQSRLAEGTLKETPLQKLLVEHGEAILGGASLLEGRFPLLFKFIDAAETLSVQVHPDVKACALLGKGARPKTEAWYIVDCRPGAKLYVGLKDGVTAQAFSRAIGDGTVEELLHQVHVAPGDFVYLPSGTVHAIGAGVLLAEVQQSSNTTYRVFDWNRVGLDGKPRQLHIDEALASIHFGSSGLPPANEPKSGRSGISCDDFIMESVVFQDGELQVLQGEGPLAVMGVRGAGQVSIDADGEKGTLTLGETRLIPAKQAARVQLVAKGEITVLATRIPI